MKIFYTSTQKLLFACFLFLGTIAAQAQTAPGFGCKPGVAYLWYSTSNSLVEINTNGPVAETILKSYSPAELTGTFNNLGYNPIDGNLYLHKFTTNQLLRIKPDLSVEYLTITGLPAGTYNSGEFDANGIFYIMNGSATTKTIHKVDLSNPASGTYLGNFTLSQTVSEALTDLTVNPVDGNLYGVIQTGNLYRITPTTGSVATICNLGSTGINDGSAKVAVFSDPAGYLYFRTEQGTVLYKVTTPVQNFVCGSPSSAAAVVAYTGLTFTGAGDGTRCSSAPFIEPKISGSVWNDASGNAIKDGTEPFITNGTVWANLVNPITHAVIQSVQVDAMGNYIFTTVTPNTNYEIILSNSNQTGNSNLTNATLPAGFVNTGVNLAGTQSTANTTGVITVNSGTNGLFNQNFGIEILPTAGITTHAPLINDGTPKPLDVSKFETADVDGTVTAIHIPNFPVDLLVFTINGTNYTLANWPVGGVKVPVSGGAVQASMAVIPKPETVVTHIPFYSIDNANLPSLLPGRVNLLFESPGTLPVKFTSFTVSKFDNNAIIKFVTATEINTKVFVIERNKIGTTEWVSIATIAALGNGGNGTNYTFADKQVPLGTYQYRVKAVDLDGKNSFSDVRIVNFDAPQRISLLTNPVTDLLTVINIPVHTQLKIVNMFGTTLTVVNNASGTTKINTSVLAAGTYLLTAIIDNKKVVSLKFVKQ